MIFERLVHLGVVLGQEISVPVSSLVALVATLVGLALGFAAWVVKQLMDVTRVLAVLVARVDAQDEDIRELKQGRLPDPHRPHDDR